MSKPKKKPGEVEIQWRVKSQDPSLPSGDLKWTYCCYVPAARAQDAVTSLTSRHDSPPVMEIRINPKHAI